jgi:hypothetical protein
MRFLDPHPVLQRFEKYSRTASTPGRHEAGPYARPQERVLGLTNRDLKVPANPSAESNSDSVILNELYAETAAVLNVPVGAVRSRLSPGRAQLRRLMGMDARTFEPPIRLLEQINALTPRRPRRAIWRSISVAERARPLRNRMGTRRLSIRGLGPRTLIARCSLRLFL